MLNNIIPSSSCYGATKQREEFEKPWFLNGISSSLKYPVACNGDLLILGRSLDCRCEESFDKLRTGSDEAVISPH